MKATFIGGGSHRLLGILREAMAERRIFEGGEIYLHDLNLARAEAMGRMLMKTPEFAKIRCRIRWGNELDTALENADLVGVILMAGSVLSFRLGDEASRRHGFLSSDNISPNGAFLALKGAPILMKIARRMEKLCPEAWLLDFANPVAVHSGLINHYTRIRALGVCAGFTNHQWDIARLLGKDEQALDLDVQSAGVNHMSVVIKASRGGKDLFPLLDRCLGERWKMPRLQSYWGPDGQANIRNSVTRLRDIYRQYGVLLFSTEPEGLWHLRYEEALAEDRRKHPPLAPAAFKAKIARELQARRAADEDFQSWLDRDLDAAFWAGRGEQDLTFRHATHDIFATILKGAAGIRPVRIATSRPNEGAVAGFKDRTILEYTQVLHKNTIRTAGQYEIPDVIHGVIGALATHQTLLADALGANDPRLLAHALLAFPVHPYSDSLRALCRDLLTINAKEIPPVFRKTRDYLR